MDKKRVAWLALIVLALLSLILICSLDIRMLVLGCYWYRCAPERTFHVLDWELPASLFPYGSVVNHIYVPSEGIGAAEDGSQVIYWNQGKGIAGYQIQRFIRIEKATYQFDKNKEYLSDWDTGEKWLPSDKLDFSSKTADAFYVACGLRSSILRCAMVARYQEYAIYFDAVIDNDMTYSEFEEILFYIDEQISNRLYP